MNETDHFFDWKGFKFSLKLAAVFLGTATLGHYTLLYVQPYLEPAASTTIVTEQKAPFVSVVTAEPISSTTPVRIINSLSIADVVPKEGKFIAADLSAMKLYLYQDGAMTAEYPIITKGRPGTPWETPGGFYSILSKERTHFSTIGKVYMPYSLQIYGNYFIHGWTYYPDGTPVSASFTGGCIKLSTEDAASVFAFADKGTGVFVYDNKKTSVETSVILGSLAAPRISAASYLVADVDTGDVFLERNAEVPQPIESVTKLMTALVANEIVSFDKKISVAKGKLTHPENADDTVPETFLVGDLFYPLLMESNNTVADALAKYYGTTGFIGWMNTTAKALDMQSTYFADASGISESNVSTPDDLFRLAVYLANKKSFVFKITSTPDKDVTAYDGTSYHFSNSNALASYTDFIGGHVGRTSPAQDTMLSVFSVPLNEEKRRVAVVVLGSNNYATDTEELASWFMKSAEQGSNLIGTSCASCAKTPKYRKIDIK
ncbi:MAG: L,D-transpeptidase family protein [bacterium]|nr:L,D-transpeptidase family protein [bacterium]